VGDQTVESIPVSQADAYVADFQRGISLRESAQFEESKDLLEKVVTGRSLARGAEHQDTVAAKSQLGRTLREMGAERDRARALHEECLALRRQVLGNDHDWTKNSMRILADTLDRMGLIDDARRLREEAGPIQTANVIDPSNARLDTRGDLSSRSDQDTDQGMITSRVEHKIWVEVRSKPLVKWRPQ